MDKDESGPERTCIVTRKKAHPDAMLRFVLGPDGNVVPDIRRRLPGRGVWVGAEAALVDKAARGVFSRGFKTKVAADPMLAAQVGDILARDALQSLAMANKAGAVIAGFAKVEAALSAGTVAALLHATDGSGDGIRKLDAAARGARGTPVSIKLFSSQQLDLALGRTNVIHAALALGQAGEAFLTRCRRAISYRDPAAHPKADAAAVPV
ncbi:MAG: RNA-binding protein [Caulobacteraceae bacterium]|nr:RNA-binding protein [Caulobacter sp.]